MSNDASYNVAADELRSFIEQIEQREAEKRDIADQVKDIYAEAKGLGYSAPVIRELVKQRRKNPDDLAEAEAIMDIYRAALGMV